MSLNAEWRDRVDSWIRELEAHFYAPLGEVRFEGFVVTEHLSAEEARTRDFQPMPPGTEWGKKWEYAWLRTEVTVPPEAGEKRLALQTGVNVWSLVLVNGKEIDSLWDEPELPLILSRDCKPGETLDVLIEAYAGHGRRACHAGPTPPDRETVPEVTAPQRRLEEGTFGIWNDDVFQLWADVQTLLQARDSMDPESLRVAEIDEGLRKFTLTVDFEQSREPFFKSVLLARVLMKPLMERINGPTVPVLYAIGHGHLDTAWLWPVAESRRKAARTIARQLALAEEYSDHKFLFSQAAHHRWLKELYPNLYERVKRAVADGRVVAEGGMWVEADTNITGGESLIRQFLHGKRFFRDEYGIDNEILWLPDVFGYSGALPQIMAGCGIKYFATAKIFWAYHGGEPFPYNTFTWEGIDGSTVLVHLMNDYNSETSPRAVARRWNERVQKDGIWSRLFPFGEGDGGGGPRRRHLEFARRVKDFEGVPKLEIASPNEFFHDLEERGIPDARYVGELYFAGHRGTYTSQAKTKKGNRRGEQALREAEMWGVAAAEIKGLAFPSMKIDEAWKTLLLHQFHDILPGSSIARVHEETESDLARVVTVADEHTSAATKALVDAADAVTVFNSLSWPRTALVEMPDKTLAEVSVPSCGWTTVTKSDDVSSGVTATETVLENDLLRVELDGAGRVTSIFDKEDDRELAAGSCNDMKMYKDVPSRWDAWDIDSMYADQPVDLDATARVEVVSAGPLVGKVRIERRLNDSSMTQDMILRRGSRRVDFVTAVDWQERHKMLKVAFPVVVHADHALHEIQFGHIARPNHRSRPADAERFEVCNHRWTALVEGNRGCAVLNDCKYGVNVRGNCIELTLLKSAMAPDMTADRGEQRFTYAFTAWNGPLANCDPLREAYDLNVPVRTVRGSAGERSLLAVSVPNVVVETLKPAEDRAGDVVVRLYEAARSATRCTLTVGLPVASVEETDMLERPGRALPVANGRIDLDFRPFEIKTLRLRLRQRGV